MLFYEEYSFSGMLVGFKHIRDSHIFMGDGFDSSLFRVIQRLFDPNNLHTYPWYNTTILAGALIVIYIFFNRNERSIKSIFTNNVFIGYLISNC